MPTKQNKGFTLLEILLVIAAIGILAAIVLVAINPNRQIAQVRDANRRSDINTIYKALEQYLIDNGSYPNSVNSNYKEICNTGTEQVGGATDCSGKADLRVLVPTYLAAIPTDPSGGEYRVGINILNNRIGIDATGVESGQSIVINFPTEFDADALAYITVVETADGQALEDGVKIAINNFIIGLKTDGIWESIKASVIMAGARTLNGALVPLKGPAPTNFNFVAGDYNRKTGLKGNGSTKYMDTNYKISYSLTGENLHLGIVGSENLNSGRPFGVFRHSQYTRHYLPVDMNGPGTGWGSGTNTTNQASGHYISTRQTGQSPVRYYNGQFNVALNTDNSQPSDWSVTAFVSHGSQTGLSTEVENFNSYSLARLQMYHIGDGLSALQAANLSTRVSALINAINNAIP